MSTCERFLYASIGGAALAVGWALRRAPRGAYAAALVVVAALAAGSVARTRMWLSDDALWEATLAENESPRGRNFLAAKLRLEALAQRDRATKLPQGEERAAALARTKELLEASLEHAHRAIALRYAFELTPVSRSQITRYSETLASNVCHILRRDEEALLHAERALSGEATPQYMDDVAEYDRALALFALGYTPQAIGAMRRALEQRGMKPDAEIASYMREGAKTCEDAGLFASAEDGYSAAVVAAADDAARSDAQSRLDALRAKPRRPDAAAVERHEIARLDEQLARLTKRCPSVDYPPAARE
jgi:tetratricopeptide (TPR) repeat protein